MWAALGRLGVAQAVGLARLIAVRPAAAGAFSIPHVTMATHFSKDQEERIRCVKGDLFSCPGTDALAHCISEDCRMGAGIAVLFKKKFGGVQELLDQKKKTGEVAVLQRDERYIYYLITKQKVSHKPTYENMQKSLEAMKAHCLNNGVTDISMPRIGCGLDGLQWEKVSAILEEVFENTDIKITVYSLADTRHPFQSDACDEWLHNNISFLNTSEAQGISSLTAKGSQQ